jgi:tetratricopeptide (TPR) repeat protein
MALASWLTLVAIASVHADDPWVGKTIIVKKNGVQFGHTDPKTGKQVLLGVLTRMDYVVRRENAQFVAVRQEDKEGWVRKDDVVLLENAMDYFSSVFRMNPQNDDAFARRAAAHEKKGELDPAIRDLDEAIRLNPTIPVWWSNRGNAWIDKKEFDKAIKDFDIAVRLDPKYANAFNDRGHCWIVKKEYAKAIADFDAAIRLAPTNPYPLNDKAWLLATCADAKIRDGKTAMQLAKRACELSDWKDTGLLDTLAAACAEAGQFDDAVKWQQKALEDSEYAKEFGAAAKIKLQMYKEKKPYREE